MILKPAALAAQLNKNFAALYLLTGPEQLLCNQAAKEIQTAWSQIHPADPSKMDLHLAGDWAQLFQAANNYSIFSDQRFLDARYDKKTLDKAAQNQIISYLDHYNPRCLIILRAPALGTKALSNLNAHSNIIHIHFQALTAFALTQWIQNALKSHGMRYQPDVPEIIHQYSQHNLHACAQIIEKLSITHEPGAPLTCADVMPHLIDQSEFSMYELADTCLQGDLAHALHILQRLRAERAQPTLILWLLAQEMRQLIELQHKLTSMSLQAAGRQQKIWPQRIMLYEAALLRLNQQNTHELLKTAQKLDQQIKSNQNPHIWHGLEQWIMCWIPAL